MQGLPKSLEVLAKRLEYLLLTAELATKTCHDTGSGKQRLCFGNNLFHVFPDFTRLRDEFTDNQAIQ
jgi:hypothetical protein